MSNVKETSTSVSDRSSINRDAANASDRRLALQACLNGRWASADIGRLERVDNDNYHGWLMWRWKKDDS